MMSDHSQLQDERIVLARDIGAIRDAFIEQRRQSHADEGRVVTNDDILTEWYCSEEFAQLMSIQGHLAKKQVLQTSGKL